MLGFQVRVLVASVSLLSAACSGDAEWSRTEIDGLIGYNSGVWGSSANDVFVVGGVRGASIQHFDGQRWESMDAPAQTPALIWVHGFAPNDVYAVGERGAFIHYDGTRWERLDSNTSKTLWGVWGDSPDDLWLVGGEVRDGRPTIRRWNGRESEVFEVDTSEYDEDVHSLFKVWGDGESVYAVGQRSTILRYQGDGWKRVETSDSVQDFIAIWGHPDQGIVAVGGRGRGQLGYFNGSGFDVEGIDLFSGVAAVYACSDRVYVGGDTGFVGTLDVSARELSEEYLAINSIHAMWSDCKGTTFAVGGFFISPEQPAVAVIRR